MNWYQYILELYGTNWLASYILFDGKYKMFPNYGSWYEL